MKRFALILLPLALGSGRAQADAFRCDSVDDLLPRIESCTDNDEAYKAATSCRDRLLQEWQNAEGELASVMSVRDANLDTKQQADYANNHADLAKAVDKLRSLIDLTKNNTDLVAQYPRAMFDNPYAKPGFDHSSNCYKNVFQKIVKIVADLDRKTHEGKVALGATDGLRGVVQSRDDRIRDSAGGGLASGAKGIGTGVNQNGASDVTGIQEDQAKSRSVASTATGPVLGKPEFPAAPPREIAKSPTVSAQNNGASTVTAAARGDLPSGGLSRKLDPSGTYALRGSLGAGNAVAPLQAQASRAANGSGAEASVGDVLWGRGEGDGQNLQLAVATAAPAPVSEAATVVLERVGNGANPESAPREKFSSREIASADEDLFRIVSRHYRSSPLFAAKSVRR